MKVMKTVLLAEVFDLRRGFVVARQDVNAVASRLQDLAAFLKTAGPVPEITGREVIVRFGGHQALEGVMIAVNIGKNEQLQRPMIAREAARVVPIARKPGRLPCVALAQEDIVTAVGLAYFRPAGSRRRRCSKVFDPGRGTA
jgi:hypothetical protein